MQRSTTSENSREEHLVEVALDRRHHSSSSIKGAAPGTGLPPEDCRPRRASSFRACRGPSADSQSVDARRGGPDTGSPRCHVPLPRRTAGRSTSQRSLSTGLTSAHGPQRGRPGDGASPGRLPARGVSSFRAYRRPSTSCPHKCLDPLPPENPASQRGPIFTGPPTPW
jgi:hypothetical protein